MTPVRARLSGAHLPAQCVVQGADVGSLFTDTGKSLVAVLLSMPFTTDRSSTRFLAVESSRWMVVMTIRLFHLDQ